MGSHNLISIKRSGYFSRNFCCRVIICRYSDIHIPCVGFARDCCSRNRENNRSRCGCPSSNSHSPLLLCRSMILDRQIDLGYRLKSQVTIFGCSSICGNFFGDHFTSKIGAVDFYHSIDPGHIAVNANIPWYSRIGYASRDRLHGCTQIHGSMYPVRAACRGIGSGNVIVS